MTTITEFLLARIAEDEERAHRGAVVEGGDFMLAALPMPLFDAMRAAFPKRVLAECEAKRRIVEAHDPVDDEPDSWCNVCDGDGWPCATMAALASVYADHPDYREEWRP